MRKIRFEERGRQSVVVVEDMPRQSSVYHLAKDLDARLYLLEYDEEQSRYSLHIGKRSLTPARIEKAMVCKDIDSSLLYIDHELAGRGHFLFNDAGDTSAFYITDERGYLVGSRHLHTILSYRPRDGQFLDIEYRAPRHHEPEGLRAI